MNIALNDVRCMAMGPGKKGKWQGWIVLDVEGWRPMLSTGPDFDSETDAVDKMVEMVEKIRGLEEFAMFKNELPLCRRVMSTDDTEVTP